MKKSRTRDIIVVGFALFAMFLGAANIIFPPYLGANSGEQFLLAILGFTLTGTGLPMLGILATSSAGGLAESVPEKVGPRFARVFITLLVLFIGPLFAVPRTAATTVELSVVPFLPDSFPSHLILPIGSAVFFTICLYFVLSPSNAIDKIGSILTPFLLVFLLGMIILSVVRPIDTPVAMSEVYNKYGSFHAGFTTGYQTMDALAAMLFCSFVTGTLKDKGYNQEESKKIMVPVTLICGLGTSIVYGGFIWIGASGSKYLQGIESYGELTVKAVELLGGLAGQIVLALIIFLACCTTAIGLIMTASDYFYKLFKEKISYRTLAIIITLISYAISIIGVNGIIILAVPILEVIYPSVIILFVLNLLGRHIKYREVYIFALIFAIPAIALNILDLYQSTKDWADYWLKFFPLGDAGFGAFIPAALGAVIGHYFAKYRGSEEISYETANS